MTPELDRDDRIHAFLLGTMSELERVAFERELADDAALQQDVRAAQAVVVGILSAVPQVDPPEHLRAEVLERVAGSNGTRQTWGSVPAPENVQAARTHGTETALLRGVHQATRWPAPFSWPAWVAAAASIAVALGMATYAVRLRQDITSLQGRLDAATSRLADAESSVARMERAVTEAQSQTAVLAAPDLAQVALAGQPPAPDARARAFWSRSRGLVFTASQLPPLPSGRSYQLWVVTANERISAGVLALAADGRVLHIVQTPADMPTPVAMAVTLEPEGGVPQPTGAFYLLGTTGL